MSSQTFNVGDPVRVVFRDSQEKLDFSRYLNHGIDDRLLNDFIAPVLNSQVLYVNRPEHARLKYLNEQYRLRHLPGLVGVSLKLEHVRRDLDYPYILYVPAEMLHRVVFTTITRRLTVRPE